MSYRWKKARLWASAVWPARESWVLPTALWGSILPGARWHLRERNSRSTIPARWSARAWPLWARTGKGWDCSLTSPLSWISALQPCRTRINSWKITGLSRCGTQRRSATMPIRWSRIWISAAPPRSRTQAAFPEETSRRSAWPGL